MPRSPASTGSSVSPRFDETFLRKLEQLALAAKRVSSRGARGARHARRAGAGMEFADHRDYTPGDDLRHVDWNLLGRLERPLVRLFDEDEDLPVYVLVDTSASMTLGRPSKLQLALESAAAVAYVALAHLDRVAVYPMSDALGAGMGLVRGKGRIHRLLDLLGDVDPCGRTDLRAGVTALIARHRQRGVVLLVSDFYDPQGPSEALDRLRYARFEPVVVQITAPDEAAPPERGELTLIDAETGEERSITVTPAVVEAYRERFQARLRTLERFCRERAVPCFQVRSDHPLDDLVLRVFRQGGILA